MIAKQTFWLFARGVSIIKRQAMETNNTQQTKNNRKYIKEKSLKAEECECLSDWDQLMTFLILFKAYHFSPPLS
jgi:hypothetical protein